MRCGSEAFAYEIDCCCGPHPHGRRHLTKKEKVEHLKEYKKQLESEITGVKEKIEELGKSN